VGYIRDTKMKKAGLWLTLPFLSWRHYIDTMLDFCLTGGKIEAQKMLDLQNKSAIKSF
jgi:hypothetical protein